VELVGPKDGTQVGPVIVLWSRVTAAWAKVRPFKVAPVCMAILVPDRMFPSKELFEPIILPAETSLHHTLQGSPPVTVELAEVVRVAADLKIQTPAPLSVRLPVSRNASAQYTPGPSGETVVKSLGPVPDQLVVQGWSIPVEPPVLHTFVMSFIAVVSNPGLTVALAAGGAKPSTEYIVPPTSASVRPINEPEAGLKPTSRPITEAGTLVILVSAKIEKLAAVPRLGEVAAYATGDKINDALTKAIMAVFRAFMLCPLALLY
jgi:hypothetical protein